MTGTTKPKPDRRDRRTNRQGWGEFRAKPRGGYATITIFQAMTAWALYRRGLLRPFDVRLLLALAELRETRPDPRFGRAEPTEPIRFRPEELCRRFGFAVGPVRAGLRRLTRLGLLRQFGATISFAEETSDLVLEGEVARQIGDLLESFPMPGRIVPIPRPILRLLARSAEMARIAVVLGHAFRCLFKRPGGVRGRGAVKARWVVEIFGVSLASVRKYRAELIRIGWLIARETAQGVLNRFVQWFDVDLVCGGAPTFSPVNPVGPVATDRVENGPPLARNRIENGPPKNNQPSRREDSKQPTNWEMTPPPPNQSPPAWDRMVPQDLRDPGRLETLFRQAQSRGFVQGCEADRLQFFAAAKRALGRADSNACGFFRRVVEGALWTHITQAEEDLGREALRRCPQGPQEGSPSIKTTICPTPPVEIGSDVRAVLSIRRTLEDATGGPLLWSTVFRLLTEGRSSSGDDRQPQPPGRAGILIGGGLPPGWDRARFDRAIAASDGDDRAQAITMGPSKLSVALLGLASRLGLAMGAS